MFNRVNEAILIADIKYSVPINYWKFIKKFENKMMMFVIFNILIYYNS